MHAMSRFAAISVSADGKLIVKRMLNDNENDLSLQGETDAASDVSRQRSIIPSARKMMTKPVPIWPVPISKPPVNQMEEDDSANPPAKRLKYVQSNFCRVGDLSRRC